MLNKMTNMLLELNKRIKPIAVVLERGMAEEAWQKTTKSLVSAGIPVFPSLERAAKAIANVCQYADNHKTINNI
jgi:acyl-CoA synthetase (NDP forming)